VDGRPLTVEHLRALTEEIARLRGEMIAVRAELAALRQAIDAPEQRQLPFPPPDPAEQMVDLDQIAAIVHLKKRSLENYRNRMPTPRLQGRRGRRSRWVWAEVRPWLQQEFGLILPENYPGQGG
jgi:hypothetical protein